jgi:hypothetical protein
MAGAFTIAAAHRGPRDWSIARLMSIVASLEIPVKVLVRPQRQQLQT